jgi:hypothetical protein
MSEEVETFCLKDNSAEQRECHYDKLLPVISMLQPVCLPVRQKVSTPLLLKVPWEVLAVMSVVGVVVAILLMANVHWP